MTTDSLYEKYHKKSKKQLKIISDKNFTYINIVPILNSWLLKKTSSILDIGCGSGTISLYLASKGFKVKGIDISHKAIRACKDSAQALRLKNVTFEVCNFPAALPRERFDFVFFSEVIEHLEDDDLALRKVHRLLAPKGILFLSTPSIHAPLHKLGLTKNFDKEVGHIRRYNVEDLRIKLKKNGFSIKKIYLKEGLLRNFLFINPIAGKSVRFIRYNLVDVFNIFDNLLLALFGASQIVIIAKKS